ncbi:hypothetical protein E2P63_01560 [Candidatus Bathyarchaeota archaeon]|nr:hypothetical protein E2P63_01560 [Candidatus Bathyarchaeota archaeon]
MRKLIATTFCILMLCSLLVMMISGTTMAAEPGYERVSYSTVVMPTIDGAWTSEDEWTDTEVTTIGEDVSFRSTWDMGDLVTTRWIVEFLSDTTDDAEDMWQFCIDGDQSGGTAPQAGDYKFEITGHTTLVWYVGDGAGWVEVALDASEIQWAATLTDTPTNGTAHWVLEFAIPKNGGTVQMGIYWNLRVGVYDASNSAAGVLAWPPTSADVPNAWGVEGYTMDPIPEGLSFGVMAVLSSISMVVGYKYFVKRKETEVEA